MCPTDDTMAAVSAALRTRPSAETFPLDDLVGWAWAGRIRIPRFQRGLRWGQRGVVRLFDSILNGFPVGSLLLWERRAPADEVVLGPLRITAPAGESYYVVDGQQRITALAAALHPDGDGDPRFQIGYDLTSGQFVPRPSHQSAGFVPAHVLYDLTKLLGWFRDRPQLEDLFDDAAAVSKTLRDLRIPAFDRLAEATGMQHLHLNEVASETVRRAVDAWPAVARQALPGHSQVRSAIDAMISRRAATLGRRPHA